MEIAAVSFQSFGGGLQMELPAAARTETVGRTLEAGSGPSETSCSIQKTIFHDKYPQVLLSGKIRNRDKSTDFCLTGGFPEENPLFLFHYNPKASKANRCRAAVPPAPAGGSIGQDGPQVRLKQAKAWFGPSLCDNAEAKEQRVVTETTRRFAGSCRVTTRE